MTCDLSSELEKAERGRFIINRPWRCFVLSSSATRSRSCPTRQPQRQQSQVHVDADFGEQKDGAHDEQDDGYVAENRKVRIHGHTPVSLGCWLYCTQPARREQESSRRPSLVATQKDGAYNGIARQTLFKGGLMRYRIFLNDRADPVQVDGDKIIMTSGSGDLVVEKESKKVAEFKNAAWMGWIEGEEPKKKAGTSFA